MDGFKEFDLFLESLSFVLSVNVSQRLVVQILQPKQHYYFYYLHIGLLLYSAVWSCNVSDTR